MKLFFFLLSLLLFLQAQAQSNGADKSGESSSYSVGLIAGPYLPSKVPGLEESLQVFGLRIGTNTQFGNFESEGWLGNGAGVNYRSVALNYRLNIANDYLPVHALAGLHVDTYQQADSTSASGGGWQLGGGAEAKLFGSLFARSDFEYRFGPGNSLLVLVSLMFAL